MPLFILVFLLISRLMRKSAGTSMENADRAWKLAITIADQHGLDFVDAVRQLEVDPAEQPLGW